MVDWLHNFVTGFGDRREARKYAANMLRAGFIRHTVNKNTFSEQCYYVFGDLCSGERTGDVRGGFGGMRSGPLCFDGDRRCDVTQMGRLSFQLGQQMSLLAQLWC